MPSGGARASMSVIGFPSASRTTCHTISPSAASSRCRAAGRSPSRCCPKWTTATPAVRRLDSAETTARTSTATRGEQSGPNQWFNTAAFSMPAYGTFGNAGRNILEGPGYQNVNLALLKRVALRGRTSLQLRAEAFNLLNRTNFDLPDNFCGRRPSGRCCQPGAASYSVWRAVRVLSRPIRRRLSRTWSRTPTSLN